MSDSTWYHGGVPGLEVGARILPPDITGATQRLSGVAGEFYPCKPAIFESTYEPVEATTDAK